MTGRTIAVIGSDYVMAALGSPGTFYKSRWQEIKVTGISKDEDVPLDVRKSLVGLTVPTIFSEKQLKSMGVNMEILGIPEDSRLAYVPDVVEVLRSSERHSEAENLREVCPEPLDMYVFEEEIHELA